MRIHLFAALAVLAAGFVLAISPTGWALVILCVGLVWSMECVNTSIERLADRVSVDQDPLIGQAKDCAAAAVLVASVASAVIGAIVFLPRIFDWLTQRPL